MALILALARAAEDGAAEIAFTISGDSMRAGIAIARWFESEARRIYAQWQDDEAEEVADRERGSLPALAARLAEILKKGRHTLDDLHKATGRNVPGPRMRAALAILKSSGKARMFLVVGPRGGRPAETWEGVSS